MRAWLVALVGCVLVAEKLTGVEARVPVEGTLEDEERAKAYLKDVEVLLTDACLKVSNARWNHSVNLTERNKNRSIEASLEMSRLNKEIWKNMTMFKWTTFKDEHTRVVYKRKSVLGSAILPDQEKRELVQIIADMSQNHASAKICPFKRQSTSPDECNVPLDPVIKDTLEESRDYDELLHVWNEWRKVSGKPVKEKYLRYVELENKAAKLNGFDDASQLWQETYEYEGFEESMARLWKQLEPLYQELHAYVRARLMEVYGDKIKDDGPIPAHLLGHIHSQHWHALNELTQPFPEKRAENITVAMRKKGMTVMDMFKLAEEFFTSLGLPPMPQIFWEKSLLVKPKDREVVCHASAWDFCGTGDVRIKQCTQVKGDDLRVVHHEMGHIEYDLLYAKQPIFFRTGANPGFHEAVGDTIALSFSTPKHLKAIGLLKGDADDYERHINQLFSVALSKIAALPSLYIYDLWRWNVFKGHYKPEEFNKAWWDLLLQYQGICPGVARTPEDFDPPSKFHISGSVPYIRYFTSAVMQFQFYKALCEEAKHVGPLHTCDFYRSKEAGKLFSDVLSLGKSRKWTEALSLLTKGRTGEMDAGPLLEYFQPLYEWLKLRNENRTVGWKNPVSTSCPVARQ